MNTRLERQADMEDTEYGVCACSHGKSDHDLSADHPACFECPHDQSHHVYVED